MNNIDFNIIMTASYIPSHPSIEIIKETIESLKHINYKGIKKIKVILAHDYSIENNYNKYFDNLELYCKEYNKNNNLQLQIIKRENHGH